MILVLDASVAFWACGERGRFESLGAELVAPWLMLSECASALRGAVWRREITAPAGSAMLDLLLEAPVTARSHPSLHVEATRIAARLGWAKTYDAEYLALAQLLETKVVTLDARLRRGAARTGRVVALDEVLSKLR